MRSEGNEDTLTAAHLEVPHESGTPTVAICIGTYNQSQYLRRSIQSALAQTYPIQEIWVADDRSTDDTAAVMAEICQAHPGIRYHRQPENMGLPRNLSWLLSQPTTDLIVRLDSDDCLEPDYVKVLAALMQQYPKAGFAHCDVYELDVQNVQRRVRRIARTNTYESPDEMLKSNASGMRTAANCILYRPQALREANYYIPNIGWRYSEDWDLVLRIAAQGWGNVYSPQILSNYRVWDDPQGVRATRKMSEVQTTNEIYRKTLMPEYEKRGWSVAPLKRYMTKRAVGFAEAMDSPLFSAKDRIEYERLLVELGGSAELSVALFLAKHGLSPFMRWQKRVRIRLKDAVKRALRATRAKQPAHS